MSIPKTLLTALLLLLLSRLAAQNTSSPYSRYGYGILEPPAMGKSRSMGGIGLGLRDKLSVNPLNPASFSAVDTLNFVFDFGLSDACSFYNEGSSSQINSDGKFDYMAMKIPLASNWGVALGLHSFSNVGYSFSSTGNVVTGDGKEYYNETRSGTGGLNTLFLGTGVTLGKHLSLGASVKYVFGMISYGTSVNYEASSDKDYTKSDNWYLGTPDLELGVQYQWLWATKHRMILGGSFSNRTAFLMKEVEDVKITTKSDTTTVTTHPAFDLPATMGLGATYTFDNRLTVGVDYRKQMWNSSSFCGVKDTLSDNTRLACGLEYQPALVAKKYFQAVKYRMGMYYTDSYLRFPSGTLKDIGVTMGFGFPLKGQKSALNVAFEAGKLILPSAGMIREHYFKVSLDIAFNEMWFMKRKL